MYATIGTYTLEIVGRDDELVYIEGPSQIVHIVTAEQLAALGVA